MPAYEVPTNELAQKIAEVESQGERPTGHPILIKPGVWLVLTVTAFRGDGIERRGDA